MDINTLVVAISFCAMTAVSCYSANIWYKYFNDGLDA